MAKLGLAISQFRETLNDNDRQNFACLETLSQPRVEDAIRLAEEINDSGSRLHRKWKGYGTRLYGLLSQVQVLTAVGDAVVGGSQNLIASGVWAVMRLSLTVSMSYLKFFDEISLILMRVGHSSAIHRDHIRLFPQNRELKALVFEYLAILVDMCRKIVLYRTKRTVTQLTSSLSLEINLSDAQTRLDIYANLINGKVAVLNSKLAVKNTDLLTAIRRQQSRTVEEDGRSRSMVECVDLIMRLCPDQDTHEKAWRHERRHGDVLWVFENDQYQKWCHAPTPELEVGSPEQAVSVLLISGTLGSGKTVLMANMVDKILAQQCEGKATHVTYVFCHHWKAADLDAESIIATIAGQYAKQALDLLTNNGSSDRAGNLRFLNELKEVIRALATSAGDVSTISSVLNAFWQYVQGPLYILIDGVDDCEPDEIVLLCERLTSAKTRDGIRLCISVRQDSPARGVLQRELKDPPALSMTNTKKDKELEDFIITELQNREMFMQLNSELQQLVAEILIAGASSMFLWATLQMDFLFPKYESSTISDRELLSILKTLPMKLYEIYKATLEKVKPNRRNHRLLEFITASYRGLTTSELFIALNVQPGSREWDNDTLMRCQDAAKTIYNCSGGLLQVDEDETVHFLHHSVVTFLHGGQPDGQNPPNWACLDTEQADLHLGEVCLAYLDLKIHARDLTVKTDFRLPLRQPANALRGIPEALNGHSPILSSALTSTIDLTLRNFVWMQNRQTSSGPNSDRDRAIAIDRLVRERQGRTVQYDATALKPYATEHWIHHCDHLVVEAESTARRTQLTRTIRSPLDKIMRHECTIKPQFPWSKATPHKAAVRWVLTNQHHRLFWVLLEDAFTKDKSIKITSVDRAQRRRNLISMAQDTSLPHFRLLGDGFPHDIFGYLPELLPPGADVKTNHIIQLAHACQADFPGGSIAHFLVALQRAVTESRGEGKYPLMPLSRVLLLGLKN